MKKIKKILVFEPSGNISGGYGQKTKRFENLFQSLEEEFSDKGIDIISHDDINYAKDEQEETFNIIDTAENLLVIHFTDVHPTDGLFPKLTQLKKAIGIYHTDFWSNGRFKKNEFANSIHNGSNRFVAGTDNVKENITDFVVAILNRKPNPYHDLIGFDPLLESKLLIWKHLNNQYHEAPGNFKVAQEKINKKIAPYIKNSEQELTLWQSFTKENFNEEGLSVLYEKMFDG